MSILATGSASSSAPPRAFLARWVDHASWPEWSPDTEWVRIDGLVVEGATGRLKPKGGPVVRFEVRVCREDAMSAAYTDVSRFPAPG